jgi:hypothetical protein
MSCINKASREYRALQDIYGDNLAEAFVRGYPLNKGKSRDMEFDIPNNVQIKAWLTEQKENIPKYMKRAMEHNPYMSETAIKSLLKGVVSKFNDKYFVTTGWLFGGSSVMGAEVFETIYQPNIGVMEKLQEMYPDIFNLRNTGNDYTTIVEITPREQPEQEVNEKDEDDVEPEIAKSMRTYQSIVDNNNGRKPVEFMAGNFKWRLNNKGLYNLIDKFTSEIYLANVDLETGETIPSVPLTAPVNEVKRDRVFRSVLELIKEQKLDEYLAVKGIDVADIYEDLRDAKTENDLNKVIDTLLKALC